MICLNCCRIRNNKLTIFSTFIRYLSQNNSFANNETLHSDIKHGIKVAMIGCPNAGKSALTNAIIRANVCAVSTKIDTTRHVIFSI